MISTRYDSAKKYWCGNEDPSPMFHENVTVARAVLYLLKLNPDKACQISADDGSQRTNGEIYEDTFKIALNMQKNGCSKGDVIGFVCKNSHQLTPTILACLYLGAPINALDVAFTKDEIINMFRTTKPKFVFCDDDVARTVQRSLLELESRATIIVIGQRVANFAHIDDFLDDKGSQMEIMSLIMNPPEVDKNSCAAILCSSGTTGPAKGVALSHMTLQLQFCRPVMTLFIEQNDKVFSFSSLYWLSGYTMMFMSFFLGVTRIITTKPFSPEYAIKIIKDYDVALLFLPPAQTSLLVNSPAFEKDSLANVKSYMCGGSLVTQELAMKVRQYVTNGLFTVGYGCTESGGISAQMMPSAKVSVGNLAAGVTVKLLNEEGNQVGVGESGEICVKSRTQFLGYYNNPKATKEILDKDGWIHTGDIGHFEEDGQLYITGRNKEMFKYSSYQIAPSELEEILETHSGVLQAVVVGIPDPTYTDLPAAVIVRKNGSTVTEEELMKFVEGKVMDYKKLRGGVYFVNEVPMTPSGKIRKMKVRELAISLFKAKSNL
ncbi:probable 4-coumarate--CoA ligase 3 [Phlebotomus papatasi]|uniref:probable 4-coumarate--CoA ligase 3 n=1 Tax=Phlebotomus papatasi TaxID=29031 RepID=UPI00248464D9|nr:probable 4-coumarate--CoA ligase 3 [Phlebotomus papatasi]